jgi:hypothetical protein
MTLTHYHIPETSTGSILTGSFLTTSLNDDLLTLATTIKWQQVPAVSV